MLHRSIPRAFLLSLLSALLLVTEVSAEDLGSLQVEVLSRSGLAIRGAYVAVVHEQDRWSEPLKEEVLSSSHRVVWRIPPGYYLAVVGAPGFGLEYLPAFEVRKGIPTQLSVLLDELVLVHGRILGREGSPIPGARIGDVRSFTTGFALELSPLGEGHLRKNFQATSNPRGEFSLGLHPSAGHLLWAEAEGQTPRSWVNLRLAEAQVALAEVRLEPGAKLALRLEQQPTGADNGYDQVFLQPDEASKPGSIEPALARQLWRRSLPNPLPRWLALPAGNHEIWVKGSATGAHSVTPRRLHTLALAAGSEQTVDLRLPRAKPAVLPSGRPWALFLRGVAAESLRDLRLEVWDGDHKQETTSRVAEVSGGSRIEAASGCSAGRSLLLANADWLGILSEVESQACDATNELPLWRKSTLKLVLVPPAKEKLPQAARLRFQPCLRDLGRVQANPLAAVPAQINENGLLEAPAPAGCFDASIDVGAFAPLVLPNLNLEPGRVTTLGRHSLTFGAAVLARVVSSRDGRGVAGARVAITESESVAPVFQQRSPAWWSAMPRSGTTDEEGWIRLYGLPAKDLTLFVGSPGRQFPELGLALALRPREERVLDAIEISGAARLCVSVETPEPDAGARPRPVEVAAEGANPHHWTSSISLSARVDEGDEACFPELPAGRWRLTGLTRDERGRQVPAGELEVELLAGEDRKVTMAITDLLFKGRVTYRGAPVEGSLVLAPLPVDGRRRTTLRLDKEGRFTVPLEGRGRYRGEVRDLMGELAPGLIALVDFQDSSDELELRVSDAGLSGVVLLEDGGAASGARVEAQLLESGSGESSPFERLQRRESTGRQGDFGITALPAGRWELWAELGETESDRAVVELVEDERVDHLELVLRAQEKIRGRVESAAGLPLAGGYGVVTFSPASPGGSAQSEGWQADGNGDFSVRTPHERPSLANVQVFASDGRVFCKFASLQEPLILRQPEGEGIARLELPKSYFQGTNSLAYWLVREDGSFLSLEGALRAASPSVGEPSKARALRLPAGRWRVVQIASSAAEAMLAQGLGSALPGLSTFSLSAGSEAQGKISDGSEEPATEAGNRETKPTTTEE